MSLPTLQAIVGQLLILLSVCCFALVLLHAFGRSVGTGLWVLCVPVFNVLYGFTQFEHRYKGLVLAGWVGGFLIGVTLRLLSVAS